MSENPREEPAMCVGRASCLVTYIDTNDDGGGILNG